MTSIYNATPHPINFYDKADVEIDVAQRKLIATIGSKPIYIVSNLYRSAVQALGGDTSKFATVTDTVYSAGDIKPCGCLALAIG